MLSKELEFTLNHAFKEAREKRHEYMTVEHLLLCLLDNPTAAKVLRACGADDGKLRKDVATFIEETTPLIAGAMPARRSRRSAFSGCCSGRCSMCSPPARKRSPAPTCWLRCSASRTARRSTC
jgi:hypothetical protein